MNNCTGVLGVFNCQGAGRWPCSENIEQSEVSAQISGHVSASDIEYFEEISGKLWTGDCAVYSFNKGTSNAFKSSITITMSHTYLEMLMK